MKDVPIDNNSLAHTSWNCKYHTVFAPKYRRKIYFGISQRQKFVDDISEIWQHEVCIPKP